MSIDAYPEGPMQRLARREFGDPDVRKILEGMSVPSLIVQFGQHVTVTRYAEPFGSRSGGWRQGDPLPGLRADDPAVMQAIGRCAAASVQLQGGIEMRSLHDATRCAWCIYPAAERLAACDWAIFRSRFVVAEMAVWHSDPVARRGSTYQRTLRQDVYENPTWAAFWGLPVSERERRVTAAQYPEETP